MAATILAQQAAQSLTVDMSTRGRVTYVLFLRSANAKNFRGGESKKKRGGVVYSIYTYIENTV